MSSSSRRPTSGWGSSMNTIVTSRPSWRIRRASATLSTSAPPTSPFHRTSAKRGLSALCADEFDVALPLIWKEHRPREESGQDRTANAESGHITGELPPNAQAMAKSAISGWESSLRYQLRPKHRWPGKRPLGQDRPASCERPAVVVAERCTQWPLVHEQWPFDARSLGLRGLEPLLLWDAIL